MTTDNLNYYRQRAVEELAAAERAVDPEVSQIHREMAQRYRAFLAGDASVAEPSGTEFAGPGAVLA